MISSNNKILVNARNTIDTDAYTFMMSRQGFTGNCFTKQIQIRKFEQFLPFVLEVHTKRNVVTKSFFYWLDREYQTSNIFEILEEKSEMIIGLKYEKTSRLCYGYGSY